jgi:hypothetical protein
MPWRYRDTLILPLTSTSYILVLRTTNAFPCNSLMFVFQDWMQSILPPQRHRVLHNGKGCSADVFLAVVEWYRMSSLYGRKLSSQFLCQFVFSYVGLYKTRPRCRLLLWMTLCWCVSSFVYFRKKCLAISVVLWEEVSRPVLGCMTFFCRVLNFNTAVSCNPEAIVFLR